jgi:hypothetical protein
VEHLEICLQSRPGHHLLRNQHRLCRDELWHPEDQAAAAAGRQIDVLFSARPVLTRRAANASKFLGFGCALSDHSRSRPVSRRGGTIGREISRGRSRRVKSVKFGTPLRNYTSIGRAAASLTRGARGACGPRVVPGEPAI